MTLALDGEVLQDKTTKRTLPTSQCDALIHMKLLQCVLQCVAVCYIVLQCAAVCCSVLQCVAVCCSVSCVSGVT